MVPAVNRRVCHALGLQLSRKAQSVWQDRQGFSPRRRRGFWAFWAFGVCGGSILRPETGPWRGQIAPSSTFLGPGALSSLRAGEGWQGLHCKSLNSNEMVDLKHDI